MPKKERVKRKPKICALCGIDAKQHLSRHMLRYHGGGSFKKATSAQIINGDFPE